LAGIAPEQAAFLADDRWSHIGAAKVLADFWQTTLTLYSIRAVLNDFSSRIG
jgi:hypothetical protein